MLSLRRPRLEIPAYAATLHHISAKATSFKSIVAPPPEARDLEDEALHANMRSAANSTTCTMTRAVWSRFSESESSASSFVVFLDIVKRSLPPARRSPGS